MTDFQKLNGENDGKNFQLKLHKIVCSFSCYPFHLNQNIFLGIPEYLKTKRMTHRHSRFDLTGMTGLILYL